MSGNGNAIVPGSKFGLWTVVSPGTTPARWNVISFIRPLDGFDLRTVECAYSPYVGGDRETVQHVIEKLKDAFYVNDLFRMISALLPQRAPKYPGAFRGKRYGVGMTKKILESARQEAIARMSKSAYWPKETP